MAVTPITGVSIPLQTSASTASAANTTGQGFAKYLSNALDEANTLSNQADQLAATFVAGGPVTVDQLMVAEQKASLAVDLVVQVRNRVVSAYQSIMNMQI
jgi:flagellar hook-basal body complex protein FliE